MIILLVVLVIASLTATAVSVIHNNGKSSASNRVIASGSANPGTSFYILPYF
jgi:flagellar basal body-associated protein FliL